LQNLDEEPSAGFNYDVVSFSENSTLTSLENFSQRNTQRLKFVLMPEQIRMIESRLRAYGDKMAGRSRN
jgi:hypothetical protein